MTSWMKHKIFDKKARYSNNRICVSVLRRDSVGAKSREHDGWSGSSCEPYYCLQDKPLLNPI